MSQTLRLQIAFFMSALLMAFPSWADASTDSDTLESMRNATARLQALKADPKKTDEAKILQETWDVLYASATGPTGDRGSEEFLHELFTLTDAYIEVDDSGAAMDVFSDYLDRHKKKIEAYKASKSRKTGYDVIERVLKAEKDYGNATDSPSEPSPAPGPTTSKSREPLKTR